MSSDRIEFEDDAPLELTFSDELEQVSRDEVSSPSETIGEKLDKEIKKFKIKEKKPQLKLRKEKPRVKKMKEEFKPKDYIVVECQLCQREYTHAKKDEKGAFIPFALCQHVIFKGVVLEE